MKTKYLLIFTVFTFFLSSCDFNLEQLENKQNTETQTDLNIQNLEVFSGFDWKNENSVLITIHTKDNTGAPVSNVKISIWTNFEESSGVQILNGITNQHGVFSTTYHFEAYMEELVVKTNFLGFIPEVKVPIENGVVNYTFGDTKENQIQNSKNSYSYLKKLEHTIKRKINANVNINYLGTFDSQGVPDYLEPEGDEISAEFLQNINTALPERNPVPIYHPEYLTTGTEHNLIIKEDAEVWITFVSEGAGYRNVLAYYTYDRDFPPTTKEDIEDCYVIFPNSSFNQLGGGLFSGDKVSLGVFPENTVIGWMLMRNGWNGNQATEGSGLLFSNLELNPEPNIDHRQHCVLLLDDDRDLFIIGFEDLIRPGGDNDFNDAVFYATANPFENIEIENVIIANPDPIDTDGDGVVDVSDDYPNDPNLAFNNYYSSEGHYGTLAFEDLWPSKGDYDFNDLVIDYNFNRISNAQNEVSSLVGKFVVRAIGANYKNGFGFTIEGLSPNQIESVEGTQYTESYIQTNENGTESGQSSATIIVFDNAWQHGHGNTRESQPYIVPDTLTLNIKLTTPIASETFGMAPFNPFIIVNLERGKEVHLADYEPSDLVDPSYFLDSHDDTQPENSKYYKTKNNLPWALNFPSKFEYLLEGESIDKAHLNFIPWVLSNGFQYKNWYKNENGFRDNSKIYNE